MARQCSAAGTRLLLLAYNHAASAAPSTAAELGARGFGPSSSGHSLQLLRQAAASAFAKQGFSTAAALQQAAEPAALRVKSPYRRLRSLVNDYKKLSKFRLSALVALTASAGYAAGSGDSIDYAQLAWTSLGTLGAAACANTLNQLYEVFNDSRMTRTMNRPLPAGRLSTRHAKMFALLTGAAGLWVLAEKVCPGDGGGCLRSNHDCCLQFRVVALEQLGLVLSGGGVVKSTDHMWSTICLVHDAVVAS
jgi:hypothetical protein